MRHRCWSSSRNWPAGTTFFASARSLRRAAPLPAALTAAPTSSSARRTFDTRSDPPEAGGPRHARDLVLAGKARVVVVDRADLGRLEVEVEERAAVPSAIGVLVTGRREDAVEGLLEVEHVFAL